MDDLLLGFSPQAFGSLKEGLEPCELIEHSLLGDEHLVAQDQLKATLVQASDVSAVRSIRLQCFEAAKLKGLLVGPLLAVKMSPGLEVSRLLMIRTHSHHQIELLVKMPPFKSDGSPLVDHLILVNEVPPLSKEVEFDGVLLFLDHKQ